MGIDILLRSVPILRSDHPTIRVIIAGAGPMRVALRRLSVELGIANIVSFLGRISDDLLIQWYQACDLFILPSLAMEGFGMATVEAMSCGAPVVGTPVGATPELLEGLPPHLLATGATANEIAAAIRRVLTLGDLRALREKVRDHAVKRYDARTLADSVVRLLRQMRLKSRYPKVDRQYAGSAHE
jgi:glycosyltransferase involved in cell wall biosynthesis